MFSGDQRSGVNPEQKSKILEMFPFPDDGDKDGLRNVGPLFRIDTADRWKRLYRVNVQGRLIFCYAVPHNLL
jgi:hypothetical protein